MPIPKRTLTEVLITEQTCGDACWHAKEDICHCSCGGKNHGCLRTEDGEQPARTRKIKNAMYQLIAVETYSETECKAATMEPINKLSDIIEDNAVKADVINKEDLWNKTYCKTSLPCYIKTASEGEVSRWPELSTWRKEELKSSWYRPITLWVRADLLHLVPEQK